MIFPLPEDNLGYAVLLSLDRGNSFGSGFRLKYLDNNYLVTAKHVLFDDKNNLRCETLILTINSFVNYDDEPFIFEIEMSEATIYKSHSDDVAVILLGTNIKLYDDSIPLKEDSREIKRPAQLVTEPYINVAKNGVGRFVSLDREATRGLNEIKISNDVYLMGYPTSLGLKNENYFDSTRPLLRKGIIAGINPKQNTFIIDCPSFYGNSGGPIIEFGEDLLYRVIGIVSKYVPLEIQWKNSREAIVNVEYVNSGYTVCVPINSVFELIDSNTK